MFGLYLELDQFIRSIEINRDQAFSFFLGAGASISSGIPSAYDCIWNWKQKIYVSQTGHDLGNLDYKSENVKQFIQKWLNSEGSYPSLDNSEEYSTYIEKCYPIEDDRRAFFKSICEGKDPSIGYHLLALLHEVGLVQSIWTTNFDDLSSNALITNKSIVIDISLDSADRIIRPLSKSELLLIKFHGDYKFGPLKNTSEELKKQDELFRERLIEYLKDKHLLVIGYSGRDNSIMDALIEGYKKKGGGRLYWCGNSREISPKVQKLIEVARENGRTAFYIPTDGFDKTMISLAGACTKDNETANAKFYDRLKKLNIDDVRTPFSMNVTALSTVIKSNFFEISFPQEVFQFDFIFQDGEKPWHTLRSMTSETNIVAVPHGKQVWALGTLSDINKAFANRIVGKVNRIPVTETIPRKETALHHLLMSGLVKLLSDKHKLRTNNRDIIWKPSSSTTRHIGDRIYFAHSAIRLSLVFDGFRHFVSFLPHVYITSEDDSPVSKEVRTEVGRTYFEKMRNKEFNDYINDWRLLFLNSDSAFVSIEFPQNSGSGFIYSIRRNQGFAKIMKSNEKYGKNLISTFPQNLLYHQGIQYQEPNLIFYPRKSGMSERPQDFHPMRGMSVNRPYDHDLVNSIFESTIRLGVICSAGTSQKFSDFLNRVQTKTETQGRNSAYLIDYPGFFEAYGVSLNIPQVGQENWVLLDKPSGSVLKDLALSFRNNIKKNIDQLSADGLRKVIVICIPQKALDYCSYDLENEHFDLHDYIKAYCAEKSIATQFIQESTIDDSLHCQINWWLSLSYFVKSLRTPWVLDSLDTETAFAGIGYSVTKKNESSEIVLGCSHIYNAKGQGLKYRISRVEDKLIWDRMERPHLSYKDSYSFGMSIIDLFYTTMNSLPRRVVIHKRHYYMQEEIKGLKESLLGSGIKELDLIEINYEDDIRYVAGKIDHNGQPDIKSYPIDRGTCILLNNYEALLWTHGVTPSVQNPNFNYYLGGRYIPAPLKITKHFGSSNIGTIANEILGLTKVNWNSFDMYTQLPATVSSSHEIARIGKLLSKREGSTYDYRYFI